MIFILLSYALAQPWTIISDTENSLPETITVSDWLVPSKEWAQTPPQSDLQRLRLALENTSRFIEKYRDDNTIMPIGMLSRLHLRIEDIEETLDFILQTIHKQPHLLADVAWWESNFDCYQLHNLQKEKAPDQIRLTKYVIYQTRGSRYKTPTFNHALWKVPKEENQSVESAKETKQPLRTRLTRQEILNGALENEYAGAAEPLAWLTKQQVLEAIMQGTIQVTFSDGDTKLFNVHKSNEIPYVRELSSLEQKRYWYFKEVDQVYGWGREDKVVLEPMIHFAGDIQNLGLGHLLWIQAEEKSYVGVLGDTGGAFQPNLGQLDWFIGMARDKKHFYQRTAALPQYAKVGILIRKESTPSSYK